MESSISAGFKTRPSRLTAELLAELQIDLSADQGTRSFLKSLTLSLLRLMLDG
jgi:hypothetical protein